MKRGISAAVILVILLLLSAGCLGSAQSSKGQITVGSKADSEGILLSKIITLMLNGNGFDIIEKPQIGPTMIVRKALTTGEIQMYPEYTGNGAIFFNEMDSPVWKDAQAGYERIKELDMNANGIAWLRPAPANNAWGIAIPAALSEKENVKSLKDLAAYIKRGGYIKLIASEEFVSNTAVLPAFQKAYAFYLRPDQLVKISGANTAQAEQAAAEGTDGVNAAMACGTDGDLAARSLVFLADPANVQPVYQPAPTVRGEVFKRYRELGSILDPVFGTLDLPTLRSLNARITAQGREAADVAREYLVSKVFLK